MNLDRAAGAAVAGAGHLVAVAPWLYTLYTFARYTEPDSPFLVVCLTATLELGLLIVCTALGRALRPSAPDFAGGLLTGWAVGLMVIPCGATAVTGLLVGLLP